MSIIHVCQVSLAVRNPFEVVKQRAQAYTHMNSLQALRYTLVQEVQLHTRTSKVFEMWVFLLASWVTNEVENLFLTRGLQVLVLVRGGFSGQGSKFSLFVAICLCLTCPTRPSCVVQVIWSFNMHPIILLCYWSQFLVVIFNTVLHNVITN